MSREQPIAFRPSVSSQGRLEINTQYAPSFAALGIDSPAGFLDLPGEVVSGHPDRHVVRVELSGFPAAFYLKRQHRVTLRERWRNWRAGFGWVSRCEREAELLKQLAAEGLPCPKCVAVGEDGRGRAFLIVEEVANSADLRRLLSNGELSQTDRRRLADSIGRLIAQLHATGFTTPDLTAKHVLVSPKKREIKLIDWQTTQRVQNVATADRYRCLAALHASVADNLATPRERLQVMRAALRPARESGIIRGRFSDIVRRVVAKSGRIAMRRSIRDQRQPARRDQRLVWLAGEAVCAIPEIAAIWPTPPVAAPFYSSGPEALTIRLLDDREALLIRGQSFDPLGRISASIRGRSWRSPGVTLGRVLFHLERYGIPAPRLLAFGQRFTGRLSAEWFALHTPPADSICEVTGAISEQLGRILRQLHDAGCRPVSNPLEVFGNDEFGITIRDVAAICLCRRMTNRDRVEDLHMLAAELIPTLRDAVERGYRLETGNSERRFPVSVCA